MTFRPSLIMSLCVALAFLILVALGMWQVQRLQWKTAILAEVDARQALPPRILPSTPEESDFYRRFSIDGQFLGDSARLFGVNHNKRRGTGFLQPFRTRDGRTLVVHRGFVVEDEPAPALLTGPATLVGQLRYTGWRGSKLFEPANGTGAAADLLFIAPDLLAERWAEVESLAPYYIQLEAPKPTGSRYPIPISTKLDIANNHLMYAITWFSFAVILLVIYLLRSLRRPEESA